MEHFSPAAKRLAVGRQATRYNHEFLEVDRCVGVRPGVEHIHHRHRQNVRIRPAQVTEERLPGGPGGSARRSQRNGQHGIRPHAALVRRAVHFAHAGIHPDLVCGVHAAERCSQLGVGEVDCLQHALAAVAGGITVPQFAGLVFPGGGTARHRGMPVCPAGQGHHGFDCRISTGIKHLPCLYLADCRIHNC